MFKSNFVISVPVFCAAFDFPVITWKKSKHDQLQIKCLDTKGLAKVSNTERFKFWVFELTILFIKVVMNNMTLFSNLILKTLSIGDTKEKLKKNFFFHKSQSKLYSFYSLGSMKIFFCKKRSKNCLLKNLPVSPSPPSPNALTSWLWVMGLWNKWLCRFRLVAKCCKRIFSPHLIGVLKKPKRNFKIFPK